MSKKILIFDRFNSAQFPGGDTIQIKAIEKYLTEQDYSVTLSHNPQADLSPFDYILIFNLTNPYEAYICAKAAVKYSKPYILFPVYWNLDQLNMPANKSWKFMLKKVLPPFLKNIIRGWHFYRINKSLMKELQLQPYEIFNTAKIIVYVLKNAFVICPNSIAEWEHLEDNFRVSELNNNYKVIYNGINLSELMSVVKDEVIFRKYNLPNEYICCVGGIGPRKNQLSLIKAANEANINIVIIGQASKGYEDYYNKVKVLAKGNIFFLGQLPQSETFKIVKSSIAHIQPSFIETPGLASLEAVALGVNIIVADTGPVREYFLENGYYCNPNDPKSIKQSLVTVYNLKKVENNIPAFIHNYDWKNVLSPLSDLLKG